MSTRQLMGRSLAFAMVLSVAGSAFARRPPALVQAQVASDRALCADENVPSGAGYRDMTARFGDDNAGTRVRSVAGYRDMIARLNVEAPLTHVACDTLDSPRLSARR
jgi:hypothetical protein